MSYFALFTRYRAMRQVSGFESISLEALGRSSPAARWFRYVLPLVASRNSPFGKRITAMCEDVSSLQTGLPWIP